MEELNKIDSYIDRYLEEVKEIAGKLDSSKVKLMIKLLQELREKNGRLFFLG